MLFALRLIVKLCSLELRPPRLDLLRAVAVDEEEESEEEEDSLERRGLREGVLGTGLKVEEQELLTLLQEERRRRWGARKESCVTSTIRRVGR